MRTIKTCTSTLSESNGSLTRFSGLLTHTSCSRIERSLLYAYWRRVLESNQFKSGCNRLHDRPDHSPYNINGAVHRIRTCKPFDRRFSKPLPHHPDTLHMVPRRASPRGLIALLLQQVLTTMPYLRQVFSTLVRRVTINLYKGDVYTAIRETYCIGTPWWVMRESNSLGPLSTGFTDRGVYLSTLITQI